MNTIPVKGSNFSFNDIGKLEQVRDGENSSDTIELLLVYPTGVTKKVYTSIIQFHSIDDWRDSLIYN